MTIVKSILAQMPAVRQPQAKFLDTLFATILALRGHVNFRNLSRYCDYSERTIQRQFRTSFDWAQFHHLTLQAVLGAADEWIEVQDASFVPKSGKHPAGLGSFFNGCAGRPERGLEISTLALVNVTRGYALTRHVAQTPATTKAQGDESRLVWYAQQVLAQRATLPAQVKYLVVDGAYAKRSYLDAVVSAAQHVITKLRCDADCYFLHTAPRVPGQRGRTRKDDGKVNFQDLSRFTCVGTLPDEAHVTVYTAVVWHKSLGRKLRLVVLVNRNDPRKPRYSVLATTEVELDAETVVRYYGARFQIEFLFRDAKQFTGLTDCQARDAQALDFHFNASLATLHLVRVSEVQTADTQALPVFSVASWKQQKFNERLIETLITKLDLEPTWIKNHPRYEEVRTYGAIAA
ncbi:MAG TPA: transposase [Blastocatellia bacterium]|nr:transposase [Blastocatellia bacterium]